MRKLFLSLLIVPMIVVALGCGSTVASQPFPSYQAEYCYTFPMDCYSGHVYYHHVYPSHYGYRAARPGSVINYTPKPRASYTSKIKAYSKSVKQKVQNKKREVKHKAIQRTRRVVNRSSKRK